MTLHFPCPVRLRTRIAPELRHLRVYFCSLCFSLLSLCSSWRTKRSCIGPHSVTKNDRFCLNFWTSVVGLKFGVPGLRSQNQAIQNSDSQAHAQRGATCRNVAQRRATWRNVAHPCRCRGAHAQRGATCRNVAQHGATWRNVAHRCRCRGSGFASHIGVVSNVATR